MELEASLLLSALWQIIHDSDNVEDVRIAISAMTNTKIGLDYLARHPLRG